MAVPRLITLAAVAFLIELNKAVLNTKECFSLHWPANPANKNSAD